MARRNLVYTLEAAAEAIGENLELVEVVVSNSDNVPYGEIVRIHDGGEGATALTEAGMEAVQDLIADIRTWPGGIRKFLLGELCEPDVIERVMADELNH
jgi:hypothetical protein